MAEEAKKEEAKAEGPKVVELDPAREEAARAAFFPKWSQEYLDLIKSTCCPKEIPNAEFAMFIEQCRRAELDPIKGEADCVARRIKTGEDARTGKGIYVTKWVFQAREAGMLSRADRFPDFRGIKAAAVYEGDTFEIDEAKGAVNHISRPTAKNRGALLGAWAYVIREGRELPVEWLDLRAYNQGNQMWGAKPHTMIVKCARAAALRRAYPRTFGECYVEGEIGEVAIPATIEAANTKAITDGSEKIHQTIDTPASTSRVDAVAAKVAQRAAQVAPPPAPKPPEVAAKPAPRAEPSGPVARYGAKDRLYGRPLVELSDADLDELEKVGADFVALPKNSGSKWLEATKTGLAEVREEKARRAEEVKRATEAEAAANAGGVLPGFESIASQIPPAPVTAEEDEDAPF